jgi:hypothetical protein
MERPMKTSTIAGLVLIILGIVSFAYQGISYTTQKKIVDIGSIHATADEKKTIPIPPVFGWVTLLGGVAIVIFSSKKSL